MSQQTAPRWLLAVCAALLLVLPARAQQASEAVPGEIIVQIDRSAQAGLSVAPSRVASLRAALSADVAERMPNTGTEVWRVSGNAADAARRLNAIPGVRAFPNYIFRMEDPVRERRSVADDGSARTRLAGAHNFAVRGEASRRTTPGRASDARRRASSIAAPGSLGSASFSAQVDGEETVLYLEDFEDADAVAEDWFFLNNSDVEGTTEWGLVDTGAPGLGQSLVAGDLAANPGYTDDAFAFAFSPVFDMTSFDADDFAYTLRFDYAAQVENFGGTFYDNFLVAVYDNADGSFLGVSDFSDDTGVLMQGEVPLNQYVGKEIYVAFILSSDASFPVGFGILVDNVALVETEPGVTNDPFLSELWGLNNDGTFADNSVEDADIDAFEAWDVTTGSKDVHVVIFDTGVDYTHPDLQDNIWVNPGEDLNGDGIVGEDERNGVDDDGNGYVDDFYGWNAYAQDNDPMDDDSHGTHIAGTIGASVNNALGVAGINHDVNIIAVKTYGGDFVSSVAGLLRSMEYVIALEDGGVDVTAINMSFRYYFDFSDEFANEFTESLQFYADEHDERGVLWVMSAGNDGLDNDSPNFFRFPSNLPISNGIVVAATGSNEQPASFTHTAEIGVDVGAPGVNVLSSILGGGYEYFSGTSMASPHVVGTLALYQAMFPEESARGLTARLYASADRKPQYQGLWQTAARANAFKGLVPDAIDRPSPTGLVASADADEGTIGLVSLVSDGQGFGTFGFVNRRDDAVEVTSVQILGGENENFSIVDDVAASTTVGPNGAYGVSVRFAPDAGDDPRDYATTLRVVTTGGTLVFRLTGRDQTLSFFALAPTFDDAGVVSVRDTLTSTFTITNDGTRDLSFALSQTLLTDDLEGTARLAERATFTPSAPLAEKAPRDVRADWDRIDAASEGRAPRAIRRITAEELADGRVFLGSPMGSLMDDDTRVLYETDFNDGADDWLVLDFGDGDEWMLEDLGDAEVDNVFLAGDFDEGYANGTLTGAYSPTLDFSALAATAEAPQFLSFGYAAELETDVDFFYVNILSEGSRIATIAQTDFDLVNDGVYRQAMVDISDYAGLPEVEFLFVANYDDSDVAGFGAFFDDVSVIVGAAPFFASTFDGTVEANSSEDVTVTVRAGVLGVGGYTLVTSVATDAFGASGADHLFSFEIEDSALDLSPDEAFLPPLFRGESTSVTFMAENITDQTLGFRAAASLRSLADDADDDGGALATARLAAREGSPAEAVKGEARVRARRSAKPGAQAQRADIVLAEDAAPSLFKASRPDLFLAEDFDASSDFPDGWRAINYTDFSIGDSWELVNLGSEDEPDGVAVLGNLFTDPPTYRNGTQAELFTPVLDFSDVPDEENVYLEFGYAVFVETGFDFFGVYVNYLDDDGNVEELELIASSEDFLANDGFYTYGFFDVTNFVAGEGEVSFSFYVESDGSVNTGFVAVDEVAVFSQEAEASVSPRSGTIAEGATQEFTVTISPDFLVPGDYVVATTISHGSEEGDEIAGVSTHETFFTLENRAPVAEDDTVFVVAGDVMPLFVLADMMLGNDADDDDDFLEVGEVSEPTYGEFKDLLLAGEPTHYVAPLNFEGEDSFLYTLTDGYDEATPARVTVMVLHQPGFVTGVQQQFTFLEDETLTLSTARMAAGVGGLDESLRIRAESSDDALTLDVDEAAHSMTLSADADAFGQFEAMFYIDGDDDGGDTVTYDSLRVTIVVAPVNDAPTADFEPDEQDAQPGVVAFSDRSGDLRDPNGRVVSWAWDFGDGTTSTERSPTHSYQAGGLYTVTLEVTDDAGATDAVTRQVNIASGVANEVGSELPKQFVLDGAYPNPAQGAATVRFGLPSASEVRVRLYDVLGREVRNGFAEPLSAGYHGIPLDLGGLTAGVYFVEVEADTTSGRAVRLQKAITVVR